MSVDVLHLAINFIESTESEAVAGAVSSGVGASFSICSAFN